jgi:aldehyde:ferredoxin oxidoreductase
MAPPVSTLRPLRGLRVDLSSRTWSEDELPAEVARAFLGGRGLGAYLALRERLYAVEPLAPENLLIFAPGPLTGTGAPASGRYSVTSRSPLTGTVFDGNSGGNWGNAFRRLGYDYLVVGGALEAPGYVSISGDGVQWHGADGLWGQDVPSSLASLRALHPGS